jgi:hypothetical protein
MGFSTVLWNITEYACYLCIILNTGLTLFGMYRGGPSAAGNEFGVNDALGILGNVVNQFNETSKGERRPGRRDRK